MGKKKSTDSSRPRVSARISPTLYEKLKSIKTKFKLRSVNELVEKTLDWVVDQADQNPDQIKAIFEHVSGESLTPFDSVWKTFYDMSWANHVFRLADKEASWSIQEYQTIKREHVGKDIYYFACHRLGYCWLVYARQLKDLAIELINSEGEIDGQEHWKMLFKGSKTAAAYAIQNNLIVAEKYGHAVSFYNLSCDYSSLAEFKTIEHIPDLLSNKSRKKTHQDLKKDSEGSIGEFLLKEKKLILDSVPDIRKDIEKSFKCLMRAFNERQSIQEMSFLGKFSLRDRDLKALRSLDQGSYQSWLDQNRMPQHRVLENLTRNEHTSDQIKFEDLIEA